MAIRATINLTKVNASVTSEVLQAGIQYTLHNATGIWTDPDSKNRFFTEEVPLADVRLTLVEKALSDAVTLADVSSLHPLKRSSDSLTFADTYTRVFAKNLADAIALDDASLINKEYYGNKGNVAFMLDVIGLSPEKIIADSITVGDVLHIAMLFAREFTDTATLDDVLGIAASKTIDPDLFTFSDVHGLQLQKTLSDGFALDDAALVDKNYFGNKGNIVGLTDLVAVSLIESRVLGRKTLNRLTLN